MTNTSDWPARLINRYLLCATLFILGLALVAGIRGVGPLYDFFIAFMFAYWAFHLARQLLYLYWALVEKRVSAEDTLIEQAENPPKVSILVPAYNEGAVISEALRSLKQLGYPNYEVLV